MKAILYTRVSTTKQATEGESLAAQESKLRAYAVFHGFEDVEVVTDAGVSGSTTNRAGFERVLQAVERKEIGAVVVYSLSRFARNTQDTLRCIERMQKRGVAFHSVTESVDTSTPVGRFFVTTLAALAQLEREQTAERTSAVLQFKKSQGERYGQVPFGKRVAADGVTLVDDEQEQAALEMVRELRRRGMSYAAIAEELEAREYRNRAGRINWSKTQVARMLKQAA